MQPRNGARSSELSLALVASQALLFVPQVIGPNADDAQALMSDYFGVPGLPPAIETPLAAARRFAGEVEVAEGCTLSGPRDEAALAQAEAAAARAQATLLFLGLNQTQESETHDRTSLALPGARPHIVGPAPHLATPCSRYEGIAVWPS